MESAHERFYPLVEMHQKAPSSLHSLVRFLDASPLVNKNRSCALFMEQSLFISWMAFRAFVICIRRSHSPQRLFHLRSLNMRS